MVTFVLTSCDRIDLLEKTISSFLKYNTHPISEYIIIDDSTKREVHDDIKEMYPGWTLILNKRNIGQVACIDRAYSHVKTPYIFHCEDDWEFLKSGFIESSLKILEHDKRVQLVQLLHPDLPIEPEVFKVDDIEYRLFGNCPSNWWHGFTWNPSLRRLSEWELVKPYTQYAVNENSAITECLVGQKLYDDYGFKAAVLNDTYIRHTGAHRMKRKV